MITDPTDIFKQSIESKNNDGDPPIIPSKENNNPPSKSKTEQFAELKKAKEDAEKKAEELQNNLEPLKPIAEYVQKKYGKIDEEAVNNFISKNKDRKNKFVEVEKTLQEKEGTIKELSIRHSKEWKENYEEPISKASEAFFATLANVDGEGNVKNPELVSHLQRSLLRTDEKGNAYNSTQIKAIIKKFAEEYEKKTGEEYEIPSIAEVSRSIESVFTKYNKAKTAEKNWDEEIRKKREEKEFEEHQETTRRTEVENKLREKEINDFIKEYNQGEIDGVITTEDFEKEIREQHNYIIQSSLGTATKRKYSNFIELTAKGNLLPSVIKKYRELEQKLKEAEEKLSSGLPHGGKKIIPKTEEAKNITKDPTKLAAEVAFA